MIYLDMCTKEHDLLMHLITYPDWFAIYRLSCDVEAVQSVPNKRFTELSYPAKAKGIMYVHTISTKAKGVMRPELIGSYFSAE